MRSYFSATTFSQLRQALLNLAPNSASHWLAARAALAVAIPVTTLWTMGRLDLAIYANFGAFTALYGRNDPPLNRLIVQAGAGTTLVVCTIIGTLTSLAAFPTWTRMTIVALIAGAVTLLSQVLRWHPPGAIFAVFCAGACATLPPSNREIRDAIIVGGGSVVISILITILFCTGRRALGPVEWFEHKEPFPGWEWEMAISLVIGTAVAGSISIAMGSNRWYWTMVAAAAALGGQHMSARIIRGIQRLLGTLIGLVLAAGILWLDLPPFAVILLVSFLQGFTELLIGRNYGLAMLTITPMAMLMIHLSSPLAPSSVLSERALNTLVGVIIGTAVAVVSAQIRLRRRKANPK